jgi:hypothetical protein
MGKGRFLARHAAATCGLDLGACVDHNAATNRNQSGVIAMASSKPRLLASGLAVAGLGAAVALGYTAPQFGKGYFAGSIGRGAPVEAARPDGIELVADRGTPPEAAPATKAATGRNVHVEAPHATVDVGKDTGRVAVTAPHTNVKVDPDKGRVQVRAPYVNLDIRW